MSEKIKLGIIGIGNMGSGHASNIKNGSCPEIELVAIVLLNEHILCTGRFCLFKNTVKVYVALAYYRHFSAVGVIL